MEHNSTQAYSPT